MVLVPTSLLFNTDPLPAFIPPAQGQIARAIAQALRTSARANPAPFVYTGAINPNTYFTDPLARELWNRFFGEDIGPSVGGPEAPIGSQGQFYRVGYSGVARRRDGSFSQTFEVNLVNGVPGTTLTVPGPVAPVARVVRNPGPPAFWGINTRGANGFNQTNASFNADIWNAPSITNLVVVPVDNPGQIERLSPFPGAPTTQPGPITPYVPITVPITPITPILPYPSEVPAFVPEPNRAPWRPVPVLPGAPGQPSDPALLPPMWITPDGIEIGTPGPGSIVVIPPGIPVTVPTTNTEEERERVPPRPAICVDTPDPPGPECCDCEDIRDIVIEELDNKFPPKRPNTVDTIEYGSANSRTIELPDFCEYVRIIVVDAPANRKTQSGGSGAANVYYNGWCSFGSLGTEGERLPVHYDDATYFTPSGARSFSYTLYHGTTATLQVRYRREVE